MFRHPLEPRNLGPAIIIKIRRMLRGCGSCPSAGTSRFKIVPAQGRVVKLHVLSSAGLPAFNVAEKATVYV
jgi:hypothetical protein